MYPDCPHTRKKQFNGISQCGIPVVICYMDELKNIAISRDEGETHILEKSLITLTFGKNYRMPIILTKNVLELQIYSYNIQPIFLTKKLKHLTYDFPSNPLIFLTKMLEHVSLLGEFNNQIVLTKHLLQVSFGSYFNQPIDLPKNLLKISIVFNSIFKQSIIFPKKITYIHINCDQVRFTFENYCTVKYFYFTNSTKDILDTLPDGVKHLQIGINHSKPLNNLPNTMINVKLRTGYCARIK